MIMTYKKNIGSIAFFLKQLIDLWQPQALQLHKIKMNLKPYDKLTRSDLIVTNAQIIISSLDECFQCKIIYNINKISTNQIKINKQLYNPFKVNIQDHNEACNFSRRSPVIQQKIKSLIVKKEYFRQNGVRTHVLLSQIGNYYCIADTFEIILYDNQGNQRGIINYKETLPFKWDLNNYSQQQIAQLQYVLEFIQNQGKNIESLQTSPSKYSTEQIITMEMLSPLKSKSRTFFQNNSLRQKKMILDKQKDQKQKYQNYMQMRKGQQIAKLKNVNRSSNQKYMSQSLAFLNINRNKLLLSKGTNQPDLPKIKAFQAKLNASINKDDKKSIVSKISGGISFAQPAKSNIQNNIQKYLQKSTEFVPLISSKDQSIKQKIKRLDLSLRQSKFENNRSTSLPILKKIQEKY